MNVVERLARRADAFQQRHRPLAFLLGVSKKFGDDNGGTLVANLAHSAFVALFPLLLLLVTLLGILLGGHPGLRRSVLHSTFAEFPVVGTQLSRNIRGLPRSSVVGLVVGTLGLVWGGVGLAQAGLFAMAQIWNVPGPERPNYPKRLLRSMGFLAVLGIGLVLSSFLAAFGTFGRHDVWLGCLGELLAATVAFLQYLVAFRVLTPKVVATRDLVVGAAVGGVAWTVLLAVGGYLIGHDLRHDSTVYGVFGAVLGLLAWVYLGAQVTVYSAEVNTVLKRRLWPRALVQPPLTPADRRTLVLEALQDRRRAEEEVFVSFPDPSEPPHDVGARERGPP